MIDDRIHDRADAFVLFFASDDDRDARVRDFLAAGAASGEALLAIVPAERREILAERLATGGVDGVVFLDAGELLAELFVDGTIDGDRFREIIGAALERSGSDRVRVYGEMVDLLWRAGRAKAAVRLEELWSDLLHERRKLARFAYTMGGLLKELAHGTDASSSSVRLARPDRAALVAELALRDQIEHALRESLRDRPASRADERKERLIVITSAVARAVTAEQVFEAVTDQMAAALGASTASLWELHGDRARLRRTFGWSPPDRAAFDDVPIDGSHSFPALDVLRSTEPMFIASQAEMLARYPALAPVVTAGREYAIACLPIVVQGRTLGSLGFTFEGAPALDQDARSLLSIVTQHAGQALERLRLLEAERASRAQAEAHAARAAALSRASRAFAECGADVHELLDTIVAHTAEDYADVCTLMLLSASGDRLEVAGLHHRDRSARAQLRELMSSSSLAVDGIMGRVATTGEPVFAPRVDQERLSQEAHPALRAWTREHMPRSLVIVPLRAAGRVIGVLSVARETMERPFDAEDLRFAQDFAERAATSIENARLSRDAQDARARAELLYALARTVISAGKVEEVAEAALDAAHRALGATRSSIRVIDGGGVLRFVSSRGLPDTFRGAVEMHSPWARDERDPQPVLVPDVSADGALEPLRDVMAAERIGAIVYVPFAVDGQLLGKLTVYYEEKRALTPQEHELAVAIANQVAAAVARFLAMHRLEEAVRNNELLVGVLGHDLRNPLAAILTATQLAMMRDASDTNTHPLARVMTSGQRMARMIDQLLDFTRLRVGGGIPLYPRKTDLAMLLRQVLDELEDANPACALELTCDGESIGHWDEDRLLQVFSNLVGNAVQHGAAAEGVRVHVDATDPDRVITVVKNGGVIPADLLPKLFLPMAGGDRRRAKSHGLGLGLFIARHMTIAHGGELAVESNEREGTTMKITLPRTTPAGGTARA
jgi:signal transduction histidine kinase